jgi:REP element-mobilizing transposase RayT
MQTQQQTAPHGKNLRKGRFSQPGGIYLITFVTVSRETLFTDLFTARLVITSLMKSKGAETLCFVVMPDHVHWLLQLRPHSELTSIIRGVKAASARQINRHLGRNGPIWQTGYHNHALRREENIREAARYIVANPLRAGLVKSVRQYPHWDAKWL